MITTVETYEDGTLIDSREIEVPDPEPVPADDIIAAVGAMTPEQKADLRAALGL